MKVFVTGTAGQLGHDVVFQLAERGHIPICRQPSGTDSKDIYPGHRKT